MFDISEYFVDVAQKEGIDTQFDDQFKANVSLHNACHTRAQSIGFKVCGHFSFL
jgi:hypothetical protein